MLKVLFGFLFLINSGYGNKVEYDCGIEFKTPENAQIFRGTKLEKFEHPWFCHFDVEYKNEIRHCSGVLISGEDILTAASCFDDAKLQYKKFKNLFCGVSSNMIPVIPKEVKKQETFGSYKLALIRIIPVSFSTHIRPICLTSFERILEGSEVTVVGSGLNMDMFIFKGDPIPRKAEITVQASSKCNSTNYKGNRTLCAGKNFVGLRDGDEGAPLLAFFRSRFYLIGIVTLENDDMPNPFLQESYPVLFTRIAPYCTTFIRDHSNVECSNNAIPIEAPSKKGFSCGAVAESRATRKRATGEDLNVLQPWYCKIRQGNIEICAGTLISYENVLSAAHCFLGTIFKDFTIHCGIDFEATAKISKVIKAENFIPDILANDIVVIELEDELDFNGKVGAACLVDYDEIVVEKLDHLIAVGSDEGKKGTSKSIRLHPSKYKNCQAEFPKLATNSTTTLCLESQTSTTTKGDSGGPLLKQFNDRWHVVGIVSAGINNKDDTVKNYLQFTRVSGFANFITQATKGNVLWSKNNNTVPSFSSSSASSASYFSSLKCFPFILLLVVSLMIVIRLL